MFSLTIRSGLVALLMLLAGVSRVAAQTHPCALPTPPSVVAVNSGQSFTLGWCLPELKTPLTGWKLYRNNVLVPSPVIVAGTTASPEGLFYYTHTRKEGAGTYTFEVAAVNAAGDGPRVPFALLAVTELNELPPPVTRPRTVRP